jgi:hypothetical protein
MKSRFLNFQKFFDKEIAVDIASHLEANNIQVELEDSDKYFDVTFANNRMLRPFWLKVKPADMIRAEDTLHAYYQNKLDLVPPDYYLFQFNDEQLMEIVRKPDEWGFLDYPLAIRILENRGLFISKDEINNINNDRIRENSIPKDSPASNIWFSYLISIFWPAGLITGGIMSYMKKTIYTGDRVYVYSEKDRKHGTRILILSTLCFVLWAIRVFL